uniref:Uncharacterized protein n=1 Tax=Lactuca sativa TaxID=4236 RepID=A0A9R1UD20_LACSA|nr:hypothetical protein LSAT_V11C900498530 [Lactuca sativa]
MPISGLREKHKQELDNMTLIAQPFKTLKLFIVAVLQYITRSLHVEELLEYARFGLWWVALGVASSIGLGSGLHTFVLYLGPHIAFFTIKAMQCGRVDLKSVVYDTIKLNRIPTWLQKDCSEFGPPLFFYPLKVFRFHLAAFCLKYKYKLFFGALELH